MADEKSLTTMAHLNEVVDLLSALKSGELGRLIGGLNANPKAGCDYDCGCNQSMCGCRGSVKGAALDTISFPEFLAIREQRLTDLRREMEKLETPTELK